MKQFKFYQPEDYENLFEFFKKTDKDYNPCLSDRPGGIERFIRRWIEKEGIAVVCRGNGQIIGSVGYWHESEITYCYWMGIVDDFKSSLLPFQILKFMFEQDKTLLNRIGYARTWPENKRSQRLIKFFGGKKVEEQTPLSKLEQIEESLPERDSYWYEFNGKEVYLRL